MLLFDQNLSAALPRHLRDEFPASSHLRDWRMTEARDAEVLALAARENLIIITKDEDFARHSTSNASVKVVWIRLGNCTTAAVVDLLRSSKGGIEEFATNPATRLLQLPGE
jgi:predicted nuclease of predicted toxin-antitoxin system